MTKIFTRRRRVALVVVPLTVLGLLAIPLGSDAFGQGGTAKPPKGAIARSRDVGEPGVDSWIRRHRLHPERHGGFHERPLPQHD